MSCNLNVRNSSVVEIIVDYAGGNQTLASSYITEITSKEVEGAYRKDFIDALKAKGIDINNINNEDKDKVVKVVKDFYNLAHPSVVNDTKFDNSDSSVAIYGYTNIDARQIGVRHAANFMLNIYYQLTNEFFDNIETDKRSYFADQAIFTLEDYIVDRLKTKTNLSEDEIRDIIESGDIIKLEELFGEKTIQDNNLLAMYKEMLGNREDFFNQVFNDSRLSQIAFEKKVDEFKEFERSNINDDVDYGYDQEETKDDQTDEEQDSDDVENRTDENTQRWSDPLGNNVTNYLKKVDTSVKTFLGSLKRAYTTNSNDISDNLVTDQYYGIPDVMDAEECSSVLFSDDINYTSVETMIASINDVANNIPGLAGFKQLADYCRENMDFAFLLYNNFAKFVIPKLETNVDNDSVVTKQTNRSISKNTVLRFEYLNSAKTTALQNDATSAKSFKDGISQLIKDIDEAKQNIDNQVSKNASKEHIEQLNDELNEDVKEVTAQLYIELKKFYPTIDQNSIAFYVDKANNGDVVRNIKRLLSILDQTIAGANFTQALYAEKQSEIHKAYEHNRKKENKDNKINVNNIYNKSYISTDTREAAISLANVLEKFTPVKTEFNSRNVHGNQSADVINNSIITNLMNIIKSDIALKNYGKYKFQSRQYDFSNILLEEEGVNYGLFRYDNNGELVETEYARDLLKAQLFNGASNMDTATNVLYAEMSKGDYVATSFINYFNVEDEYERSSKQKIPMANYFMRIPSDAPKNFIITAPRYEIKGLSNITNQRELNLEIQKKINSMTVDEMSDQQVALFKYQQHEPSKVSLKQFAAHLTADHPSDIVLDKERKINEENANIGDIVTITFAYKSKKGNLESYVMQGTLAEKDGKQIIAQPQFYSFIETSHVDEVTEVVSNKMMNQFAREGKIQREINTEHRVFKQLRRMFVQELTNAAVAINTIFENENGLISRYDKDVVARDKNGKRVVIHKAGEPILRDGFANNKKGTRTLYDVYHKNKNGEIYTTDSKGVEHLVGRVFSSDRFQVVHETKDSVKNRNYGQEIIDDVVDFLYGGANNAYLHITLKNGKLKVVLTDEQEAKINEKLQEFINDYIRDTRNRLEEYKEFIPDNYKSEDRVMDFALNHLLMFNNFNDLFEGDTKFYKDSQTFLKRAKEAQAGGIPYGNTNYNTDMTAEPVNVPSSLDSTTFTQIDSNGKVIGTIKYQLKDKFTGVTIKNSVRINKDFDVEGVDGAKEDGALTKQLAKVIANSLNNDGLSKEESTRLAIQQARTMMKGYHGTKVNDAQSYITFDEWIKRITARGQLGKYKNLIESILDESKPLDLQTINQFVQVQKNFYYDQYYNKDLQTMAPRQIKNAEFVIVPRFVKGTQLEQVYKLMKDNNIDQLNTEETSKAGKTNVLTIWNDDGSISENNIKDFNQNAKASVEYYSYNNLYTQQETPQHINAENKAGIQIMKKILDNIWPGSPLYKIKEDFFANYVANIKESYNDVMTRLGVELDENGNIQIDEKGMIKGLDKQVFFDMLKDELIRQGLDSNMMDYVTLADPINGNTTGITVIPTYFGNQATKLENVAQALFNSSITRQTLPGFHAAQITNIGFSPLSKQVDNVTYAKDLQYHPNEYQLKDDENVVISEREYNTKSEEEQKKYKLKGKASYIEVMLPASNFGIQRTKPDGTIKSDKEMLQELHEAGLDIIIGYRIPTEGKQSISVMKVVGFTDDALGSTIVVPDAWVAQTGSDFDIDSVYGIQFTSRVNNKTGKLEKIKYNEEATINDYISYLFRTATNNRKTNKENQVAELKDTIRALRDSNYDKSMLTNLEILVTELGYKTYNEFKTLPATERNSRNARNNRILEDMIKILSSDESMEENFSRSNFEDIIDARDAMIDKKVQERRKLRSPLNFLDQAEYQEDVMSGAKLKAFSVTRDTFCSICNTVRPFINDDNVVTIDYPASDGYNLEMLKASFNDVEEVKTSNGIVYRVKHNKIGWSLNNKNVVGKLITAYSSQTTAHILDAVKEGAIPNVNDFTFQVYKTLPDIGSDYYTAVAFIMQPGITEIVKAYNANKSIYAKNSSNPINTAFKVVARRFLQTQGVTIDEYDSMEVYEEKLKPFSEQLATLFNAKSEGFSIGLNNSSSAKLSLNRGQMKYRLSQNSSTASTPVRGLNELFDLGVIMQFYHINNLASSIGSYARVCNPDKFGAKQTIYETNKVFDDINEIVNGEDSVLKVIRKEDGHVVNLLESIYPGIGSNKTVDSFISHNSKFVSTYPPLNAFLKYATATSIKVNRELFDTQNQDFVDELIKLNYSFTGNSRMTEKQYKQLQSYTLNYLYGQTTAISTPLIYKNGGYVVNNDITSEQERRRIYGYDQSSDLNVDIFNENGEVIGTEEFDVKDINNPTEVEIRQFAKLSPAQKVLWIQRKYEDLGIFKYLAVSLFNSKNEGSAYAGMQTIRYIENNANIETVYNDFAKAFFNNNPIIAMAAFDLVKYAFVVEGYRMKRNAVNKIIKNDALLENLENGGTNIVNELNILIGQVSDASLNMGLIRHNFIRSHSNMTQIATVKVENNKNDVSELKEHTFDNMIYLTNSDDDVKLMSKYKFTSEVRQNTKQNDYIKLRHGKNIVLYKLIWGDQGVVAVPLNKLEEYENSEFSVNNENNKYRALSYYETIAYQILAPDVTISDIANIIKANEELAKQSVYKTPKKANRNVVTFDINDNKGVDAAGFASVRDKITKHFADNPKDVLYFRSQVLTKYIKNYNLSNGDIQTINGKKYVIYKYNVGKFNNSDINEKELSKKDKNFQELVRQAHNHGYVINDMFVAKPILEDKAINDTNNTRSSSVTELEVNTAFVDNVRRLDREGDKDAKIIVNALNNNDITSKKDSLLANMSAVTALHAKWVTENVDNIIETIEHGFTISSVDENGHWTNETVRIDDIRLIDWIRNNADERNRFLNTLLRGRSFIKNYQMLNELNITSEDEDVKNNLERIRKAVKQLTESNVINKAEENFANEYLAKVSESPYIQQVVFSLLDGYHSSGMIDSMINDLQEAPNPLIQIVTKEVMGDIRAKEMQAYKEIEQIKKRIADIKERARKAGLNINWDNIVDENGKLIQDYKQEFIDAIDNLRDAMSSAKINYGEGSIQYLEAKRNYDKFKLHHIHQELTDDYYVERLALDEDMINHFPAIFSEFKKLDAERKKVFKLATNGILSGEHLKQYKEIREKINELASKYYYDESLDGYVEKPLKGNPNNPFNGTRLENIYEASAATALRSYLQKTKELNEKYFDNQSEYGFEEDLEHYLEIVESAEQRINGVITTPENILGMNETYLKAKSWLEQNARFVVDEEIQKKLNKAYKDLKEAKYGRSILSKIVKDRNLYDNEGNIKADELTDEEIDKIRTEQLDNYGIRENQAYADKHLISNAPTDDTIFEQSFYSGMKTNGISNPEYLAKVKEINNILKNYYNSKTKTVYTAEMSEEDLKELIRLYDEIEDIDKTKKSTNGRRVYNYIKNNVEFVYDYDKYNEQKRLVQSRDQRIIDLWYQLNERIEEIDGSDQIVPNRFIYGYAVPKGYKSDGTGNNSLVNKKKTEALRTINKYTQTIKTSYYYKKFSEMSRKSEAEFNDWYYKNHIYNPHTHKYEPLNCWTKIRIIDNNGDSVNGTWMPAYHKQITTPKEEYENQYYKGKGSSLASNYKHNPNNTTYDNNTSLNQYEQEMRSLVEEVIRDNVKTEVGKRFFDKGYMIAKAKGVEHDAKFYGKQVANFLGWINNSTGREDWTVDEDVDYASDKTIEMPLGTLLKNKETQKVTYTKPTRKENESDNEYEQRLKQFNDEQKAIKKENDRIHGQLIDRNFEAVIEDFILKSAHYNAIQDNKLMLFYAKNMIDKIDVYVKNEGFNDLQRNIQRSSEDNNVYVTKKDSNLQKQYVNWIRRLVYDQWKQPNNLLTRASNVAQSFTSAKFMMLNVTGGIANITVGATQIYAEILANEYLDHFSAARGLSDWSTNVGSFIADMYSDKASSLQSAIVKAFNVVDFDEINGVVSVKDAEEYLRRVRDIAFSPQSTGEHMMQNGVLFGLLHSHRLIENTDKHKNGKTKYLYKNEAEYVRDKDEEAFLNILTDDQKALFEKFKKYELSDPNRAKEYNWYRKYFTTEFAMLYLDDETKRKYIQERERIVKKAREEFNDDENHPTLMSQLKLDEDGKMGFKEDSLLGQIEPQEAYAIIGRFKGRVISVNKKIHGVYDKLGAARLESYWYGGITMQYHKHIYPGIMKRYRRQGYFNEERGTIEKGCYWALKDFLAMPLEQTKYAKKLQEDNNMTDDELKATIGIQNIMKNYVEFATHINLYWNLLPENERANIRRAFGDFAGVISAICLAIGARVATDDKDKEKFAYNLFMYEADRLASESMMYNPFGLISEGKKLWSSPLAVQGSITDTFHTLGFIAQYIIEGEDFDGTYSSGLYAGENKLEIMLKRNIPMYHGIYMLERLDKSNKYYKLGENMLSIIPVKDIADFIKE